MDGDLSFKAKRLLNSFSSGEESPGRGWMHACSMKRVEADRAEFHWARRGNGGVSYICDACV